jgi:hypothetical protein
MDSKELYEQVRANIEEWRETKSVSLAASTMELLADALEKLKAPAEEE